LTCLAQAYLIPGEQLFELVRETVTLALSRDRRLTLSRIGPVYAEHLLERGLHTQARAVLAQLDEKGDSAHSPHGRWRLLMLRAALCTFDGELDAAQRQVEAARHIAETIGAGGAQEWAIHQVCLAVLRGELGALAADAERLLGCFRGGAWMAAQHALLLGALGHVEDGRRALREAQVAPPRFPLLVASAEACVLLADRDAAGPLYAQLLAEGDRQHFLWEPPGVVLGPTCRLLGELAALLGQTEEARRHLGDAVALCRRIGAQRFLQLSSAALGRLSPAPAAAPPRASERAALRPLLVREGAVWAVSSSAGRTSRIKHSKGLTYLHELLSCPGSELHVCALVGLDHLAGDAGPAIDKRARAEYRQHLEELQEQLREAEAFGDSHRAEQARERLELLATHVAKSLGLGGRERRAASDAERARVNVQRCVKDAIGSISEVDSELGRYLAATIRTGMYCSYNPL
jgi:hypothetical protein